MNSPAASEVAAQPGRSEREFWYHHLRGGPRAPLRLRWRAVGLSDGGIVAGDRNSVGTPLWGTAWVGRRLDMATTAPDATEVMEKVNAYEASSARKASPSFAASRWRTCAPIERGAVGAQGRPRHLHQSRRHRRHERRLRLRDPARRAALQPGRQLFEEMIYVLEGNGSTPGLVRRERKKVSFEWKAGQPVRHPAERLAPPLQRPRRRARALPRRDQRAGGDEPVPQPATSSSTRRSRFDDRFAGQARLLRRRGQAVHAGANRCMLETNFVPDAHNIELYAWKERGAGGSEHHVRAGAQHDGGAHLGVPGRHLQEGPPARARARTSSS